MNSSLRLFEFGALKRRSLGKFCNNGLQSVDKNQLEPPWRTVGSAYITNGIDPQSLTFRAIYGLAETSLRVNKKQIDQRTSNITDERQEAHFSEIPDKINFLHPHHGNTRR
jgi:hypothetical protein